MSSATRRAAPRSRRRKGVLALIGALFLASALVRIGDEATRFAAHASQSVSAEAEAEVEDPSALEIRNAKALMEALADREARVETREVEIYNRMKVLRETEAEVTEKLAALEAAETRLRETLTIAKQAAESDLSQLTDVYANMKPRQAAALFEEMDPGFAAGFLGRMPPEAAAGIMAGLSAQAAYRISVVLAGRNADVPKPGGGGAPATP